MFSLTKWHGVLGPMVFLFLASIVLGSCQNKSSKTTSSGADRVYEEGENIPLCNLPFTLENLASFQVAEGFFKVGEHVFQAPWGLTTCRREKTINGQSSVQIEKGYYQLMYFAPYKLMSKPYLEETSQGIEVRFNIASQAASEDQLKAIAKSLGAPEGLDLKESFNLQHYRFTTALVGELPMAYSNMMANSNSGYDLQIKFSNLKRNLLEKELESLGIKGKLSLLGGNSQFGASSHYWNLDFNSLSEGEVGQLSLISKVTYAQDVWRRAQSSDFDDDVASALMLVYALTRDMDSAQLKNQFLNLYTYCLDHWLQWPTVAQVESDDDNIYANTLSLLLRMEPNHSAKAVDERMQKLSQVFSYSRGNMLALSLATILDHKMSDAQFSLALKIAPAMNQQNMGPAKQWNLLVDLGNLYDWNEAKLNNIVQLTSYCMNLAKLSFDESLSLVKGFANHQMTSDEQKVLSNLYYFLQNNYSGPAFAKSRALSEALQLVFIEKIDQSKADLMVDTFRWLVNSYQVNMAKLEAYEKIKEWSRMPSYNRKSFDFMYDVFSQISNTYRQSYSKPEALLKTELWVLKVEITKDQFSLLQDLYDFLVNTYLVGLGKPEARGKAEKWVVELKLKAPQLSRIRDIFSQNVRAKGKTESLRLAEKEVLGIN